MSETAVSRGLDVRGSEPAGLPKLGANYTKEGLPELNPRSLTKPNSIRAFEEGRKSPGKTFADSQSDPEPHPKGNSVTEQMRLFLV
ncbi:uncharacterized protein VTP21DRAFT_8919 [Calcarisporiella thermophila]|uniref:uncharacterized protein n=1 Tax=Calcarisporiella thermophila TaxID=911321 RepID=UPI0037436CBF